MKLEKAVVGLKVKVKNCFYNQCLVGVYGTVLEVTSGGFIVVGFGKKYPYVSHLTAPNSTLGFDVDHFHFLPNHLKKVK